MFKLRVINVSMVAHLCITFSLGQGFNHDLSPGDTFFN